VIAETHALLARRAGGDPALAFLDTVLAPAGPQVVWAEVELAGSAIERWLRHYQDKPWSFTDAVSFEVMRRHRLREAFAFDVDFARAGFALVQ
jgi:predicted nucleic acid-binding protein